MNKILIVISILLMLGCEKRPEPLAQLPNDAVILAFGDSLTRGTGASANHDYPSILAQLTHRRVINEGVPGEISTNGLKRLPGLLDQYQPKLLILIHGGNDILKQVHEQETARNLDRMVSEAKSRNIEVVMLGVPEPSLVFMESAEIYRKIAEGHEVLIDLDTLPAILEDNKLKSDEGHPNDEGYRQMATHIYNFLKEAGAL
jgi:lysophospholipase L1-like esterase